MLFWRSLLVNGKGAKSKDGGLPEVGFFCRYQFAEHAKEVAGRNNEFAYTEKVFALVDNNQDGSSGDVSYQDALANVLN